MCVLRFLGVLVLLLPAFAGAAVRYVAQNGVDVGLCTTLVAPCATIQYAIDSSASGDTIRLHEGPAYAETIEISTALGVLTIEGGWADGFGWQHLDPAATIVDGGDSDAVLLLDPDSGTTDLRLEYLTIRNGSDTYGGGVAVHGFGSATTQVTLEHVHLRDNHAGTGGGAAARAIGGTVELRIKQSRIEGNIAGEGGGVAAIADLGGSAKVVIESSVLIHNEAQEWPDSNGWGGALYANSARLGATEVDAINTVIAQNQAEEGGIYGASGYCDGCGDTATTDIDLLNSTVTENDTHGVVARSRDHGQTTVSLTNSIAWGNPVFDIAATGDWLDSEVTAWNSDVDRTEIGHDATYTEIGTMLDTDPQFVAPAQDDYHLSEPSDLIDAGVCGIFPGFYVRLAPLADIDGELRPPVGQLWGCDIGADEYQAFERWVRPGGTDSSNDCTDATAPCGSIQHALDQAMADQGRYRNTMRLARGSYAETLDIVDPLAPVTLEGGWNDSFSSRQASGFETIIDAEGSDSAVSFSATSGGADLKLESLTLTDGSAVYGGGLAFTCLLAFGSLELSQVVLRDNHATDSGGGLQVRPIACDLEIVIAGTLITDNSAVNGGGGMLLRSDAGSTTNGYLRLSTIAGNSAGWGGGLSLPHTGSGRSWLHLKSMLLALNTSGAEMADDLWIHATFAYVSAYHSDIQTVTQYGGIYAPQPTVIAVNPGFADPAAGNYHLTPYSPVLDLGACHFSTEVDCDGEPRPAVTGCDMGADEFIGPWRPPLDLWITNERLDGIQVREACRSIVAGPTVEVATGSRAELRAPASVRMADGFEVEPGADLTVRNYLYHGCLMPLP